MIRSPKNSSTPDLSTHDKNRQEHVTTRKRKHNEDMSEVFKEFSDNIMCSLDTWKTEFGKEIIKVHESLDQIIKNDLTTLKDTTSEMKSEITKIRKDYSEMKSSVNKLTVRQDNFEREILNLQKSLQFNDSQYEDLAKKTCELSVETKKILNLEAELKCLQIENRKLKIDFNANDQRERLMNLEIVGIPEDKNENLTEILFKLASYAGLNVSRNEILHMNRITPKTKVQGRPRVILVKFASRLTKDNFFSQVRKCRITTKDINLHGEPKPIFINDHLSPHNKLLLRKCKEFTKLKQYQYVWLKNGRIYIRKNDTTHAVQITEEEDLKKTP